MKVAKKLLSILVALSLCASLSVAPLAGEPYKTEAAVDLNGDGVFSSKDAVHLLFNIFFPNLYPVEEYCDYNNDGEVTDKDAMYLLFNFFFPENYEIESHSYAWHQCPETVRAFLENVTYDPNNYAVTLIDTYVPRPVFTGNSKPAPCVIDGEEFYSNAIPGTKVFIKTENFTGTVTPADKLRMIRTDAVNVRDLGGWDCDGGSVKYGMIIRGGEVTAADREVLAEECGIKVDLDIRGSSTGSSPLGSDIEYIYNKGSYYKRALDLGGNDYLLTKNIIETIFACVKSGKPVYFHCQQGKDRTGTVACLLLGVLGVSQSDCDKDYELTTFSVEYDSRNYSYRSIYSDPLSYRAMIEYINTFAGDTFAEKIAAWMVNAGIKLEDINEFRRNMSTGNVEDLTVKK